MKVTLRGALALGGGPRQLDIAFGRAATFEEILTAAAVQAPSVGRYLAMTAETGKPPALMVIVGGRWVHPGDQVDDSSHVEIYPPITGGQAEH